MVQSQGCGSYSAGEFPPLRSLPLLLPPFVRGPFPALSPPSAGVPFRLPLLFPVFAGTRFGLLPPFGLMLLSFGFGPSGLRPRPRLRRCCSSPRRACPSGWVGRGCRRCCGPPGCPLLRVFGRSSLEAEPCGRSGRLSPRPRRLLFGRPAPPACGFSLPERLGASPERPAVRA